MRVENDLRFCTLRGRGGESVYFLSEPVLTKSLWVLWPVRTDVRPVLAEEHIP
jgi:hypothetical protein